MPSVLGVSVVRARNPSGADDSDSDSASDVTISLRLATDDTNKRQSDVNHTAALGTGIGTTEAGERGLATTVSTPVALHRLGLCPTGPVVAAGIETTTTTAVEVIEEGTPPQGDSGNVMTMTPNTMISSDDDDDDDDEVDDDDFTIRKTAVQEQSQARQQGEEEQKEEQQHGPFPAFPHSRASLLAKRGGLHAGSGSGSGWTSGAGAGTQSMFVPSQWLAASLAAQRRRRHGRGQSRGGTTGIEKETAMARRARLRRGRAAKTWAALSTNGLRVLGRGDNSGMGSGSGNGRSMRMRMMTGKTSGGGSGGGNGGGGSAESGDGGSRGETMSKEVESRVRPFRVDMRAWNCNGLRPF